MNNNSRPVLIVGLPRSGTTWVGEVLSSASRIRYLFEPDNEGLSPLAWFHKRELHRFPYLTVGNESISYYRLWRAILNGPAGTWIANNAMGLYLRRKPSEMEASIGMKCGYVYIDRAMHRVGKGGEKVRHPEKRPLLEFLVRRVASIEHSPSRKNRVIVKSVHASLSLDWISNHFPVKIIFVVRNPYSLYASYKRMKMPDSFRNLMFQNSLQRDYLNFMPKSNRSFMTSRKEPIAFQIALMYKIIEKQILSHPEWMMISHDRLCIAPQEGYRRIFEKQELVWGGATDMTIESLNKSGKGFAPKRVADQQPFKWKTELSVDEQAMIDKWTNVFELKDFYQTHISL